ncbi:hypothetical protein O0L34_g13531 [Tuta absoluta]|nr:hypothetical protein O0L34_g13531 [Tuta absoluta]
MVERGILSTYTAAARYNIPRRTLRNHLQSGSTERKLGRSAILPPEQEAGLVRRIVRLADIGVPLTPKMLRIQAYSFCKIKNIPNSFNNVKNTAGKKWLRLFLKRHPELARRKAQMMNPGRAQKLNKYIVGDHFSKYKSVLDKLGIEHKPENIYNIDEKNCRISLHHQKEVLRAKGKKRVHQIANEHAESVTVVGCGNAVGSAIPPMILFKGKRLKPEFRDNLPPGSLVRMTPKGSMTTETFIEFIDHLHKFRTAGPCLFVFDGAKCHLDFSIVDAAERCGITLYCLPLNTIHELQPMDKSVYRSFEHHWDQEYIKYVSQHPERTVNKTSFNVILSKVWPKCMTISNITSGFRATGLYLYDPDAIPEEAFAPSALSELPNPTSNENVAGMSAGSREQEISAAPVEASDELGTDTENVPLSVISDNNRSNKTPRKIDDQMKTNCDIEEFIPTPKFKVNKTAPRKKSLNYRAQKVTKDLFGDKATSSTSQITVTSSEAVPSTSAVIQSNINAPASATAAATSALAAPRNQSTADIASLTADKSTPPLKADGAMPSLKTDRSSASKLNPRSSTAKRRGAKRDNKASWYCPACRKDRVDDMRQCLTCSVWYHA